MKNPKLVLYGIISENNQKMIERKLIINKKSKPNQVVI